MLLVSRIRRFHALMVLAASMGLQAAAHETAAQHPGAVKAGWDFTLPTLDGSRFVRLRDAGGPVLVNFWGVDCPPCIAELPLLLTWAADNPRWTLLLVGTDPPATARAFVARLPGAVPSNVQWLRSGSATRALLREAGSPHGGLPHSVALQTALPSACAARAGLLDEPWLQHLERICTGTRQLQDTHQGSTQRP
jgi:thiol-disulfide isomerase/thioredoxin